MWPSSLTLAGRMRKGRMQRRTSGPSTTLNAQVCRASFIYGCALMKLMGNAARLVCAVSDVLEYAEYLGMDIKEDAHLLWIADEALQAPEPQGWEQRLDPKGGVYYYHPTTGMSLNQHPLDHHYQQFYLQMKAQYDAMYQASLEPSFSSRGLLCCE